MYMAVTSVMVSSIVLMDKGEDLMNLEWFMFTESNL